MNKKSILILSIIGAIIVSAIVGGNRDKIEAETKQAEEDSMIQVKEIFKL